MARDGDPLTHGRIYVAPPDYHLLLNGETVRLWRGPRENRLRPAINALFRSAAVEYRERVTGVVLSGSLDDGATGLWWVKRHGGCTIVQDPSEAEFPHMPRHALQYVQVDYVARAGEIGPLLATIANKSDGSAKCERKH